jgi:hypothetical protein
MTIPGEENKLRNSSLFYIHFLQYIHLSWVQQFYSALLPQTSSELARYLRMTDHLPQYSIHKYIIYPALRLTDHFYLFAEHPC